MSVRPTEQMPPGGWERPIPGLQPVAAPSAGWWSRVGATLFDMLVISVPAVVLAFVVFGSVGAAFGAGDGLGVLTLFVGFIAYVTLVLAVVVFYAPLLMRRPGERNGQTWGKQIVGIRVVRTSGVPMDFTWSAIREALVKVLGVGIASSIIPLIPWLLDVMWPLWDDENRAVHDFIVDTRVVQA